MDILNWLGWGLVWLLVLSMIGGLSFIIGYFITKAVDIYVTRRTSKPEPQHHLDADPIKDYVLAKRAKRQLEVDQWDAQFYGQLQAIHEVSARAIRELEADYMLNHLRSKDPEIYNFLMKLEQRSKYDY